MIASVPQSRSLAATRLCLRGLDRNPQLDAMIVERTERLREHCPGRPSLEILVEQVPDRRRLRTHGSHRLRIEVRVGGNSALEISEDEASSPEQPVLLALQHLFDRVEADLRRDFAMSRDASFEAFAKIPQLKLQPIQPL